MKQRAATIERKTKETDISLTINLDGTGENEIATGIPFFDHMLNGFARHGLFPTSQRKMRLVADMIRGMEGQTWSV